MILALEINDVGLVLVRDGEIVAEEPGCAMLDGRTVETGRAALERARLKPLYAETRHWQDLGTAALPRPMPAAATYADVAYAQLAALAEGLPGDDRESLLAVPGGYSREQLAVLLGVAFNSTLSALLISIVIMFLLHQLQLAQERLVLDSETSLDQYLIRHMQVR